VPLLSLAPTEMTSGTICYRYSQLSDLNSLDNSSHQTNLGFVRCITARKMYYCKLSVPQPSTPRSTDFQGRRVSRKFYAVILFLNNQKDALIIQIYSVMKLYMFRSSSLPIIRSFLLYIRHW